MCNKKNINLLSQNAQRHCRTSKYTVYYHPHPKDGRKVMFSHVSVCVFTLAGGGYPILLMGGTPFPGQDGGDPIPGLGWGVPWSTPQPRTEGTPRPGLDGVTPPPRTGWGTLWPGLDGVTPPTPWPELDVIPSSPGLDGVPPTHLPPPPLYRAA